MDLVRFFSGNNTVLTACEEDFKKFIKFMKSFNLLSTFNTKDENLNWNYFVHIAKLNNPNTFEGYILWEFTPDKGLIFLGIKRKIYRLVRLKPIEIDNLLNDVTSIKY